MQVDAAKVDAGSVAPTLPKQRLYTLESLDGRTRASQRAHALMRSFASELGRNLSSAQRLAIRHAAMMVAIAEDAAARQLSGETVDIDQLVRISNLARRAVLDLHLPKADKRQGPSLADYAAQKFAGEAEQSAGAIADGEAA
jgi:hypothetical protein